MDDSIIKTKSLEFSYDESKQVLKGIDIDIKRGERIAVLGSNGAGKSTFFLNLNGVLHPEKGDIYFHGRKMEGSRKDLNELRKAVGIVFQDADNQIIASTVLGEVSFGPLNLNKSKEEVMDIVERALGYMNLLEFKERPPHYLSGGEKKRVTIADIIAMDSEIFIFDEPTASLDPVNVDILHQVMNKLYEEGKTLMISTHDVDFAYQWAERIIVFCDGKIIADGVPEEIFKDEEILLKANLKKPVLLDIYEILDKKGILMENMECPKTVQQLEKIIK